jgi:hypothetical protein
MGLGYFATMDSVCYMVNFRSIWRYSGYSVDINMKSLSFTSLLFLVFLVLKLTGTIDWSWWLITLPLWGPLAIGLMVLVLFLGFIAITLSLPASKK